jgi:sulfate-transporting ATPase
MHNNVQLLLVGLGSGAAYAILAVGLVVIFRGSGVLNFGHGGIASIGAYTFLFLVSDHHWNKLVAALVAVVCSSLVGVLFQCNYSGAGSG